MSAVAPHFLSLSEFLQYLRQHHLCVSVCLWLVLNVNQPPADSAALSGFVCLNSAPNLLLILYAEISPPHPPPHLYKAKTLLRTCHAP